MSLPAAAPLANFVIVLDEPKDVVNIGGVVRAMMNMGLSRLRLVRPDDFDEHRIRGIAHRSEAVVAATGRYDSLPEAVADAVYVVGTSARGRAARTNAVHPRSAAPGLLERAAAGPVAMLFGREDRGLTNEGLDLCHEVIVIPTDSAYASLNLAQACLLVCYELLLAAAAFAPADELGRGKKARAAEAAPQADLERMYAALEDGLTRIAFFKGTREPVAVLRTLRGLLGRAVPSEREAKLLQAMGREIGSYLDRRQRGGDG